MFSFAFEDTSTDVDKVANVPVSPSAEITQLYNASSEQVWQKHNVPQENSNTDPLNNLLRGTILSILTLTNFITSLYLCQH